MPEARAWVLDRKITDDLVGPGLTHELRAWLDELPAGRLAELLIGGVTWRDVPDDFAGPFLPALRAAPTSRASSCRRCRTPCSPATTPPGSSRASR